MSFDAIEKVTQAEQERRDRKAEAAAEARRITDEAERAGRERLARAREDAEGQAKAMLAQAEERAEGRAQQARTENAARCAAMQADARTRLEQAAGLIVERVGQADGNR